MVVLTVKSLTTQIPRAVQFRKVYLWLALVTQSRS
jgi:hypothetical protein